MKRLASVVVAIATLVLCLVLSACGDDTNGTYYPKNTEMQSNLENNGYSVSVTTDLDEKNGTYLAAAKDNEYIEFYWLDNADACDYFYDLLKEKYHDYNSLIKIENDEKFGNIVYCGTENAINDAGIKVVDVKVKV